MQAPEPHATQPVLEPDCKVFDAHVLGAMFDDDTSLIAALLQTFVASTNASLAGIASALAAPELATVESLAHRIAGASRLSGAQTFGDSAAALEAAAKRADLPAVRAALEDLTTLWLQVQHAMGPLLAT